MASTAPTQSVQRRLPWRRLAWHIGWLVMLVTLGGFLQTSVMLKYLERQALGLQTAIYSRRHGSISENARQKIVLVKIDEDTFDDPDLRKLGQPLPRRCHAKVLRELQKAGARVVVFDLLFDIARPGQDEIFAQAARDFKSVVWAAEWLGGESPRLNPPNPRLRQAAGLTGHTATPHDELDPVADRIEAVVSTPQGPCPALSVQAARLFLGAGNKRLTAGQTELRCGPLKIPLDPGGTFKIVYGGADGAGLKPFPYEEIYRGIDKNPIWSAGQTFKGKIVLIGDTSAINKDYIATPMGRMSGLEVHGNALATVLQGSFVAEAGPRADFGILLLLTSLAWLLAACLSLRRLLAGALILLTGYFLFNTWLFVDRSLDLALMLPLISAALMTMGVALERGGSEEGIRHRLGTLLNQYVSPQVAHEGAPRGEVTLVFTDIEGSTELSERLGEKFEKVRDEHFVLLREAARRWNGFEVETAGDSLFIIFAEPADAVRFAVEGQFALAHHQWPDIFGDLPNLPGILKGALPVRIGIHTGTPFIGRDRTRLTYRGPATNRAARIMGAGHGGQILMSQKSWELASTPLASDAGFAKLQFMPRGTYQLKGVGRDSLWEVVHPELFEPPLRELRDAVIEEAP